MKRTLSAILALCMLLAMLPTFSISMAAEATPFSVDFRTVDTTTLGGTNNVFLVEETKGENWSVNASETTLRMGADIKFNIQYSPFADFQTWSSTGKVTFDFAVPADGKYNVDVYGMRRPEGGVGKFYIDGTLIGDEEFYAATAEYKVPVKKELEAVSLTAGTHKLTIEVAGKNNGSYNLLLVQRLEFTPEGYTEKAEEFVLDFTKVDTSTLNGQYAVMNETAAGPNWSIVTKISGGSTVFNKGSRVRFYANSYL